MRCCADCFGDSFLDGRIREISQQVGTCSVCSSAHVALVKPIELQDYFQSVISIYAADTATGAQSLVAWLKEDWQMFSTIDPVRAQTLLGEILNDGEIVRKLHLPRNDAAPDSVEKWATFRDEIIRKNRFFFSHELDLERLKELFDTHLATDASDFNNTLYRARIQSDDSTIPKTEMGRPPARHAKNGRANPVGIPYLYAASKAETAIAETRPHPGDRLTVAQFNVTQPLKLLNLMHPRKTISPFQVYDSELAALRNELSFLCHLENELAKPILPRVADLEYLPTQYLCEFIKNCGYDGVVFKSSISKGSNVALFSDDKVQIETVMQYEVTSLHYEQKQKGVSQ